MIVAISPLWEDKLGWKTGGRTHTYTYTRIHTHTRTLKTRLKCHVSTRDVFYRSAVSIWSVHTRLFPNREVWKKCLLRHVSARGLGCQTKIQRNYRYCTYTVSMEDIVTRRYSEIVLTGRTSTRRLKVRWYMKSHVSARDVFNGSVFSVYVQFTHGFSQTLKRESEKAYHTDKKKIKILHIYTVVGTTN